MWNFVYGSRPMDALYTQYVKLFCLIFGTMLVLLILTEI